MEEFENVNPWDCLKSIEMVFTMKNDPLFSCIITLYILVLLYFPHRFSLKIIFSPVLVLTASLLLSLLRLGAIQRIEAENVDKLTEHEDEQTEQLKWDACNKDPDVIIQSFEERFVEWNVRAPLEVIYEEYEEGDEEEEEGNDPKNPIERYPSLSLYYPESDSDSSSSSSLDMDFPVIGEWVSSEKMGYRWEEGLIEIELHKKDLDFHGEDDNLIEIDIS